MDGSRNMALPRMLTIGAIALVLALAVFGGSAWLSSSGTAVAPEPARLTVDLAGNTGSTAEARYVSSNEPTTVIKWPGWAIVHPDNWPRVFAAGSGAPCARGDLPWGAETRMVLFIYGPLSSGFYAVQCR